MPQIDSRPNNNVCASDLKQLHSALPVNQNISKERPGSPGTTLIRLLEVQPIATGQFLPYPTLPAMSLNESDTSRLEIFVGVGRSYQTLQKEDSY